MENQFIPKESETIAARRALRLAEKLEKARRALTITRAWWSDGPIEALSLGFTFLANLYIVYPFFGTASPSLAFSGPVIPLREYRFLERYL